jgi:uroporphyrinogen-III synthase
MSASADWSPAKPLPIEAVNPVNLGSTGEASEVTLLRRVAGRMSGALPLDAVLRELVEFATSVVDCDSCFIYVLEDKELVLRASKNHYPHIVGRLRIPFLFRKTPEPILALNCLLSCPKTALRHSFRSRW